MNRSMFICDPFAAVLSKRGCGNMLVHRPKGSPGKSRSRALPVYEVAAGAGLVEQALSPAAAFLNTLGTPPVIVHWAHPVGMASVLLAYGARTLSQGWQIRTSEDADAVIKAKREHAKNATIMTALFTLGGVFGLISLLQLGQPIFNSAHAWTGVIGLLLLYTQGMISLFFDDVPGARTFHAYFGTGIFVLFIIHMGLGLKLGFSF